MFNIRLFLLPCSNPWCFPSTPYEIKCNDRFHTTTFMILFPSAGWTHTHTHMRAGMLAVCSQTQHDWIFLCVFWCRGNTASLREIKQLSGRLTVPPCRLLNLPFPPRWRADWILCVYAHHVAGNWDRPATGASFTEHTWAGMKRAVFCF